MIEDFILVASVASTILGFSDAKLLADQDEASLSTTQYEALVESQGQAAGRAFQTCLPSYASQVFEPFTVVIRLNILGQVEQIWRQGNSGFAQCVEMQLAQDVFSTPPKVPFYSSLEFTFTP